MNPMPANPAQWKTIPSDFLSGNLRCSGELYLPDRVKKPPVVIMAHGFGAEKAFGLPAFAEVFAAHRMAVFLFDYRCFGGSEGIPRNYVSPSRHLADWQAAVAHVRKLPDVDAERMALWGSSFSGGHVLVTAARTRKIRAVVAQVPFVDSISTLRKMRPVYLFQATFKALRDMIRMATYRAPYNVPIIGNPEQFAMMNTPESYAGYSAIVPAGSAWQNRCPARIGLSMTLYRPTASASRIECPALIMLAENDSLIDPDAVAKTAGKIPSSELVRYSVGHFDLYTGPFFEKAVSRQTAFLMTHLGLAGPAE